MAGARIIAVAIGYLFGLFTAGYFYSRHVNVDITKVGSGNIGTTNTFRSLGPKAGVLVFLGDGFKGVFAVLLVWLLFHGRYPQGVKILEIYAGLGAVLGHNFPVHLKFKGGKGIAATAGVVLAFCPWAVPVCILLFAGAIFLTHYVSVGSMLVCISFFAQVVIFGQNGTLGAPAEALPEIYIVTGVICALGILRHHENIRRLLNGTENKALVHKDKK